MKITHFDKKACVLLGNAIEQALEKVADEYGVSIKRKNGSFMPSNYTLKLEASVIASDGIALSKEVEDFKDYCHDYNLEQADLYRVFSVNGISYKLKGLSIRSRKHPILALNLKNGKTYKLPERIVQKALYRTVKKEVPQWTPYNRVDYSLKLL